MGASHPATAVGVPLHITQKSHRRQPVFRDALDYQLYLGCLDTCLCRAPVALHAYCLTGNRVHLLLSPYSGLAVSRFMHSLNASVCQALSHRWNNGDKLLRHGRYRLRPLTSREQFFACMRYIDNNPVQSGLVQEPAAYEYSSHRHYAGLKQIPWLTEHRLYAELAASPQQRYCAYWGMF